MANNESTEIVSTKEDKILSESLFNDHNEQSEIKLEQEE